ncbi:MAG: hypothetical protein MZW92_04355 [Comamonadaceae bacterium]|nr:hypothetical protein [Comamonadaceae bacterium]
MTEQEAPIGPLAAVDMGSNSFRLEIGQLQHGRYRAHRLPEGDRAPGRRPRRPAAC